MVVPAIPEVVEEDIQSSIDARTDALQTLRELGPPDLVHLVKQSTKSHGNKIGVYHHVTGIDASSSASLAAYVNTLTYNPNEKNYKVISGTYCCYNAFSRVDMRVQVTIPGTVESYCIDEKGDKRVATDSLWLETYLCGVLRAYSYADDGTGDIIRRIIGLRRFNPITSTESEHRFLDAAERLFFKGWQLGSDPEIQVPNMVSNHLTAGLLNYIRTTGRFASGINLFEKLRTRDIEVSSLLARVLIAADEEVRAVALLYEAVQEIPMDYSLLDCQAEFLMKKGRADLALECAKRSVISAPSEFGTWARLAEVYISLEQWDLALLTLNSCPMFTYQDKDAPRLPEPSRIILPVLPESMLDELDDSPAENETELVHPSLRKLHAANYKGTFLKAYSLLTEITAKIGWDQLLKIRSTVFVMEEEYRSEKQTHSRSASNTALRGTPSPKENEELQNGATNGAEAPNGVPESGGNHEESPERPEHTVTSEEVKAGTEDPDPSHSKYTQFHHKRLCERWLDNLFMVLYEDLRVYTIWRTEMTQSRQQQLQYKKSGEEWEILGELAERLHHFDEAIEAYQACLSIRFSPKAMKAVLTMYEKQGDGRLMLQALIRLVAWQYRWYAEFSPLLLYTIRKLIEDEGAVKVRSIVQATNLPQSVLDLTHHYAALCAAFRSTGSDG
ncbi:clathrin-coated vesiclec protein [Xylona heveae TC161]|uniref:Clathrin-coated vesiclec protein n=1 Tax=Xylona heveae (strain CBS 132557 / TC161) TaxID=1328760 RepID=A0A164ZY35_XYLHT|nr:clathrin-coated vesiclec protein [Xylona heveae TC161]KZF19685.1 clathrin-coated vesiclec protein [Xylona heveae TC161]